MKNKKIYQKWVNFAKEDLKDTQILFEKKSYKNCIYHCHQAIEKILKGIIVAKGKKIRKVHDLPDLLKESEVRYTSEILEFINELNPYYNPIRYPDVVLATPLKYDKKSTQKLLLKTKEVSKWLLFQLNQKK